MSDNLTPKKKKRFIPFSFLPASWGLRGKSRDLAQAEYEYDGIDAKLRLAEIENEGDRAIMLAKLKIALDHEIITHFECESQIADLTLSGKELQLEKLNLEEKHGRKSSYDIAIERANIAHEKGTVDHQVAVLEAKIEFDRIPAYQGDVQILNLRFVEGTAEYDLDKQRVDLKHNRITQREYDKACATIRMEPWIDIVEHGFDPTKGINGVYFEFDWNIYWIDELKTAGYEGQSEMEIIDRWFAAVCRNQVQNTKLDDGPAPFSINIRS